MFLLYRDFPLKVLDSEILQRDRQITGSMVKHSFKPSIDVKVSVNYIPSVNISFSRAYYVQKRRRKWEISIYMGTID